MLLFFNILRGCVQYPKLRRRYFEVVTFSVQMAPSTIVKLPPTLFSAMMQTLEYGLGEEAVESTQKAGCLQALYDLARYVYEQQRCGGSGATGTAAMLAADGQHSQALLHFLRILFDKLLFGDLGAELVDWAADLALALILCYEQMFSSVRRFQPSTLSSLPTGIKCC